MWDGVKSGSTQSFSSAKAEARVMQRTPNGVIDYQASPERSAVMGTGCANGEEFRVAARENHILTSNLPMNHSSLWNTVDSHSACEVRYNTARHVSVLRNDSLHHAAPEVTRGRTRTGSCACWNTVRDVPRKRVLNRSVPMFSATGNLAQCRVGHLALDGNRRDVGCLASLGPACSPRVAGSGTLEDTVVKPAATAYLSEGCRDSG